MSKWMPGEELYTAAVANAKVALDASEGNSYPNRNHIDNKYVTVTLNPNPTLTVTISITNT